jgi:hypothetical protein
MIMLDPLLFHLDLLFPLLSQHDKQFLHNENFPENHFYKNKNILTKKKENFIFY